MLDEERGAGFREDEKGASLPEYALLIALIALVCIAAISLLGTKISSAMSSISGSM
jgi:pilus assembly protein Flp/PilA